MLMASILLRGFIFVKFSLKIHIIRCRWCIFRHEFLFSRVFILVGLIWTVNDYFYIAGTLNAENLVGNIFINFALVSLTELPSVFIGQFLMGKLG